MSDDIASQEIERRFASRFIRRERRERFLELAAGRRRVSRRTNKGMRKHHKYGQMITDLEHWFSVAEGDPGYVACGPHDALARLRSLGVRGECYAMSGEWDLDGELMSWEDAIAVVLDHRDNRWVDTTLLVAPTGLTAYYYHGEIMDCSAILTASRGRT